MITAWVLGGNGLLGSALNHALLRTEINLFAPTERFRWDNETNLIIQLKAAVKTFAKRVETKKHWQIYWAAGVGTMSSTGDELALETRALSTLLSLIESEPRLMLTKGGIAFASSAGAIYAGSDDDIISEYTHVAPTTAYAHEKLKQENLINTFVSTHYRVTAFLARISTLYGSGQAKTKQQGLIAGIARRIVRNQPIQIFVPFDTIRDYINVDDAAIEIVAAMVTLIDKTGVFTKIIASEQPATIAEIISIFKRIARRTPRIITSANKLSSLYTRRIQFHSIAIPVNKQISRTSLHIGIAQVMASERSAFARSLV